MDLDARSLPDLPRIEAICCANDARGRGAARGKNATRAAIVDRIRRCQPPIQVLPCRAPRLGADACDAVLELLRSLDWRAFALNKYAGANRTASRAEGCKWGEMSIGPDMKSNNLDLGRE